MFKKFTAAAITAALVLSTSLTAFAYGWHYDADMQKWWCGANEDDSVKYIDGWYLVDGDRDGNAQWYLVDYEGLLYTGCVTPDGYTVNNEGAWTVDGQVQYKAVGDTEPEKLMWFGTYVAEDGQSIHVIDVDGAGVDIAFSGYGDGGDYLEDDRLSFKDGSGLVAVRPIVSMTGDVLGEDTYTISEDGYMITVNAQSFRNGVYYRQ